MSNCDEAIRYRIKRNAKPYGGKILEQKSADEKTVTGAVILQNRATRPLKKYLRDELEEVAC